MKKTILITGAGTGIGKDTAFSLARKGHYVIATTETEEQSSALLKEADAENLKLDVYKLDITKDSDRNKVLDHDLDVLINNAGVGESGSLAEIDMNRVRNNFEVNVFSTFELSQLVLHKMLQKDHGTVLFISSIGGRITMPFLGAYSMTKFAVSSGAEALRKEIHRVSKNVHISIIEPGAFNTGFNQRNIAKKHEWMGPTSVFYSIIDQLRALEEKQFRMIESKTTKTIVRKIVKAAEAKKPSLRYSAPRWQAIGAQILRIFGK